MAAKVVKLDKTKYENDAIGFRRLEAAVFDLDRWASLSLFLSVEATQEESVAEWQHLVLEQTARAAQALKADYQKAWDDWKSSIDSKAS